MRITCKRCGKLSQESYIHAVCIDCSFQDWPNVNIEMMKLHQENEQLKKALQNIDARHILWNKIDEENKRLREELIDIYYQIRMGRIGHIGDHDVYAERSFRKSIIDEKIKALEEE